SLTLSFSVPLSLSSSLFLPHSFCLSPSSSFFLLFPLSLSLPHSLPCLSLSLSLSPLLSFSFFLSLFLLILCAHVKLSSVLHVCRDIARGYECVPVPCV